MQKTSGNQRGVLILMYPDDCIQNFLPPWWEEDTSDEVSRGRLVWAFLPHVDQIPLELEATGRTEATSHDRATYRVKQLRVDGTRRDPPLPVAALPNIPGERRGVYRVKKRPALIISNNCPEVPRELRQGQTRSQTSPTVLVAPYYGADMDGRRSGYNEEFLKRVRLCEYPQFMWDMLPLRGSNESLLRLDHIQPVGEHYYTIEATNYRLSDDAVYILDEWISWLITGNIEDSSSINLYREEILSLG